MGFWAHSTCAQLLVDCMFGKFYAYTIYVRGICRFDGVSDGVCFLFGTRSISSNVLTGCRTVLVLSLGTVSFFDCFDGVSDSVCFLFGIPPIPLDTLAGSRTFAAEKQMGLGGQRKMTVRQHA